MRCVLVPLDGTPFAEAALPVAAAIAGRAGAELRLLHVNEPVMPVAGGDGAIPLETRLTAQEARTYLDAAVGRVSAALDTSTSARPIVRGAVRDGTAARAIHDETRDAQAELVVMATHARHGIAHLLLGSTAEDVVRAGGAPVLAIPTTESPAAISLEVARPLGHLMIALDGTPHAEAVLAPALSLARLLESTITLVSVRDVGDSTKRTLLPTAMLNTSRSDERELVELGESPLDAASYLASVAKRLTADGFAVRTQLLEGHPVVERLVDATRELRPDWIAMSTHARGFWGRLIEDSVAQSVLEHVSLPVLLVHAVHDDATGGSMPRSAHESTT